MTDRGLLELTLPYQRVPDGGEFDSRPEQVQEWIASLPLANLSECSRLIRSALAWLNCTTLGTIQRHKALELLQGPIAYATDALKRQYIKSPLPLSPKLAKWAQLVTDIESEYATGYKIVATELSVRDRPRPETEILGIALYRALTHLGSVLLNAYQTYSPATPRVWREMHAIYRYAETERLHLATIGRAPGQSRTIGELYKSALLLALARPHCLMQEEMTLLYRRLQTEWAARCDLRTLESGAVPRSGWMIDLSSDAPHVATASDANAGRTLFCEGLLRLLEAEAAQASRDRDVTQDKTLRVKPAAGLNAALLHRLIGAWSRTRTRVFSRSSQSGRMLVAAGLSAAHHVITQHAHARRIADSSDQQGSARARFFEAGAKSSTTERRSEEPFEDRAAPHQAATLLESGASTRLHYVTHLCTLVNEGPGGVCLLWNEEQTPAIRIGEVIALRYINVAHDPWAVGVVRWIKSTEVGAVQFGVQMLVPSAEPVATRLGSGDDLATDYLRGLLLPELTTIGAPPTLVTANFLYRPGNVISVVSKSGERLVRLEHVVDSTRAYSRFQFADVPLGDREELPRSNSTGDASAASPA